MIQIIGLGYVGLPTALLFVEAGENVSGVDTDTEKLAAISGGTIALEDGQFLKTLRVGLETGTLRISAQAVEADVHIIAVPTPAHGPAGIDTTYVDSACRAVAQVLKPGNIVILESTVAPGVTGDMVAKCLASSGLIAGFDFDLAHIPERVLPGNTRRELTTNARIVGGINRHSAERASQVYRKFVKGDMSLTDLTTAELVKVFENAYRDVNVAIANEFLCIAESLHVDPWQAISLANLHPRVNILDPGPGVGGHCIPVDPWFLVGADPSESRLVATARERNDSMPYKVAGDIVKLLEQIGGQGRVGLLGMTYKANSPDDRNTPSQVVRNELECMGVSVAAHDPLLTRGDLSALDVILADVDLLVLLIAHDDFLHAHSEWASMTKCRHVFDCTGKLPLGEWSAAGFRVTRLGSLDT